MGYNSACVRDICEIFTSTWGFRGWAIECCQSHFSLTDPRCWAQRRLGGPACRVYKVRNTF